MKHCCDNVVNWKLVFYMKKKKKRIVMRESKMNDFMMSVITDLENSGRYSTAHVYRCALKAALSYGGVAVRLDEITPGWLVDYQAYLLSQQLLWNTISTYMRMLRAVYNRAVDAGIAPYIPHHFKNVFTGRQANHQRALEGDEMRRILSEEGEPIKKQVEDSENADVENKSGTHSRHNLLWARACLELMLRFHGMPFVDLAHLRKSDLRNGYLMIRRHKTGMPLSIEVGPRAMALLGCYAHPDPDSPYLLDILGGTFTGKQAYREYQGVLRLLNLRLSQLARKRGVGHRVSSYSARHTWATVAKRCGIPVEVISEALGHASIATTEGYLKQFDNRTIGKANKVIINYILG